MSVGVYNSPSVRKIYSSDPREVPVYSFFEVARYVKVSESTLRAWAHPRNDNRGRKTKALFAPASSTRLSFLNLLEAFTVSALTRIELLRFSKVRIAVQTLEEKFPSAHPLIDHDFWTDHIDLFIKQGLEVCNLSRWGQYEFQELIGAYLERIKRDVDLTPLKVYPFARELRFNLFKDNPEKARQEFRQASQNIEVDPLIAFGRPTITGTGVPVETIASRNRAGDTVRFIAKDYGISERQVQEAIEYERPRKVA